MHRHMRACQVNLYGYILHTEYGMTVGGYYLAVVHPELEQGRLIQCPRMDTEMALMHQYEIECGRGSASIRRRRSLYTALMMSCPRASK